MGISRKAEELLKRLAREHLIENNNAIVNMDGQEVSAFGRYTIRRRKSRYEVYRYETLAKTVYSQRVAICWCVADKYQMFKLADELANLEQQLVYREDDIEHYRYSIDKTTDSVKKSVLQSRLHNAVQQTRLLRDQLNKCISSAKYWQQKGFENETARFGLKKPSATK